jgi:hypothetical protein
MRFANVDSWQISIGADEETPAFALWLRDVEAIEVPASPLVPGPLDADDLPPPLGEAHDPRLGEEWLTWWLSLMDRGPRPTTPPVPSPDDDVAPAYDTPDPLGLARLPVLRDQVAARWTQFLHWRVAHHREHGTFSSRLPGGDPRTSETVREVETTLGRRAAAFKLTFTLLPVRDDRIRKVGAAHYLVPERVYLGVGWPARLRAVVAEVA